jgi:hypothetical protein
MAKLVRKSPARRRPIISGTVTYDSSGAKKPVSHRTGWYTVKEKSKVFPLGHGPCSLCRRALKPLDVVYVKRVSVPKGSYSRNDWSQDYYMLMHKGCIAKLLLSAPLAAPEVETAWEEIRERVASGGDLFGGNDE